MGFITLLILLLSSIAVAKSNRVLLTPEGIENAAIV